MMDLFKEKMRNVTMKDSCFEQKLGELISAKLCISKQRLSEFSIDKDASQLTIDSDGEQLQLRIEGIELKFELYYELDSNPEWFFDEGDGTVIVGGCAFNMNLKTINRNGILQIDFSDVDVDISDYSVELNGLSDLSKAIEILFNSFKSFFRKELVNMLAWRAAKSIEETLNDILFDQGEIVPLNKDSSMHLNAKMVSDPIYADGYLAIPIDGTFLSNKTK
jgi:hypothetical protein